MWAALLQEPQAALFLFTNFGPAESLYSYKAMQSLRANGIVAELYPDPSKLKKQITYANKRSIPYVVLVGDEEMASNTFTLKNMSTGTQETVDIQTLTERFTS